jgi:hypothetical protein
VEDLPGGRVQPAASAQERPNSMLDGHQAWLDGRIRPASGKLDA